MGCNFKCVLIPKEVQKVGDLRTFYKGYREDLLSRYGDDFDGYSGDMAVDNGKLEVHKDIVLKAVGGLTQESFDEGGDKWEELLELVERENVCKKWGASAAVRAGGQWVICGAYSD